MLIIVPSSGVNNLRLGGQPMLTEGFVRVGVHKVSSTNSRGNHRCCWDGCARLLALLLVVRSGVSLDP